MDDLLTAAPPAPAATRQSKPRSRSKRHPPLTDADIRAAKPQARPWKVADGGGLYLVVMPAEAGGARLWRMNYRFAGRQKTLSFGAYPGVSLADARRRREQAKRQLAAGNDPSAVRRLEKLAQRTAAANTFDALVDEYLARRTGDGAAASTIKKKTALLKLARPSLGRRPIADITAAEVLLVLRAQEVRGKRATAHTLRTEIGAIFRYAIATARAENDPTFALRGALAAPKVRHRAAIVDPAALGALLRAIDGYHGQPATRAALRLAPILAQRPGELRQAEWSEFNLDEAIWTIPATRMKMRRVHRVPLPAQAVAILRELQRITGNHKLAFPGLRSPTRPLSDATLNAALRRLDYSKEEVTTHGFRATASTLLNQARDAEGKRKWDPDAIERQLSHEEGNKIRRAYDHSEHWDERVRMMQWWADYLDTLKAGGATVIPLVVRGGQG